MPRRKRLRKVVAPPGFKGYKPYGSKSHKREHVELLYEEYEAIKLADYNNMNQQEASVIMGISRPTFARIYATARKKLARALVETREIRSVYGNARLEGKWYLCEACQARFTMPDQVRQQECPVCHSGKISIAMN